MHAAAQAAADSGGAIALNQWARSIDADELVEVTPDAVRVRKQILQTNLRPRRSDAIEDAQSI